MSSFVGLVKYAAINGISTNQWKRHFLICFAGCLRLACFHRLPEGKSSNHDHPDGVHAKPHAYTEIILWIDRFIKNGQWLENPWHSGYINATIESPGTNIVFFRSWLGASWRYQEVSRGPAAHFSHTFLDVLMWCPSNNWLVVWNMNFMTFHIFGIMIPTDVHIFQRGSNHQPDKFE